MSKLKDAPAKTYICPNCGGMFTAAGRTKAGGNCPECGVELAWRRKRNRNPGETGFLHEYYIPEDILEGLRVDEALLPKVEDIYEIVEVTGRLPEITTEKLLSPEDHPALPLYRVTFNPTPAHVKCYCPECGGYLFESGVLRTRSRNGTKQKCKNKPRNGTGQCKTETEFFFR